MCHTRDENRWVDGQWRLATVGLVQFWLWHEAIIQKKNWNNRSTNRRPIHTQFLTKELKLSQTQLRKPEIHRRTFAHLELGAKARVHIQSRGHGDISTWTGLQFCKSVSVVAHIPRRQMSIYSHRFSWACKEGPMIFLGLTGETLLFWHLSNLVEVLMTWAKIHEWFSRLWMVWCYLWMVHSIGWKDRKKKGEKCSQADKHLRSSLRWRIRRIFTNYKRWSLLTFFLPMSMHFLISVEQISWG